MFITEEKQKYKAFGLYISSEIQLPELIRIDDGIVASDIEIRFADLTNKWNEVPVDDYDFIINSNSVVFQVPGVALFSIENGKNIFVSPFENADDDIIRIFILGTCMGAVLMQKQILPLHGSAIAINGKAYAIVGDSGAGKSTLASAFLHRGYKLLSDDVIPLYPLMGKTSIAPAYPQQKLWKDSLTSLGMKSRDYQSIYGRENKYCVPVSSEFLNEPLPLGGIFELVKTEGAEISIKEITNLDRFSTIFRHTYRNFFLPRLGLMEWHFKMSAKLIQNIDMFKLDRPISGFSVDHLMWNILRTIDKGE